MSLRLFLYNRCLTRNNNPKKRLLIHTHVPWFVTKLPSIILEKSIRVILRAHAKETLQKKIVKTPLRMCRSADVSVLTVRYHGNDEDVFCVEWSWFLVYHAFSDHHSVCNWERSIGKH